MESREERIRKSRKALRKGSHVKISRLSHRKSATEHDSQNASKRAPGPLGTRGGGRPPGPYGSMADTIRWEEAKGVLVLGSSKEVATFLEMAYEQAPEVRWYAPEAPSASTWARQRQEAFMAEDYFAGRGVASDAARGLDNATPRPDITMKFEREERGAFVTVDVNDPAEVERRADAAQERAGAAAAARAGGQKPPVEPDERMRIPIDHPENTVQFLRDLADQVEDLLNDM